jgi:hypothetical protein
MALGHGDRRLRGGAPGSHTTVNDIEVIDDGDRKAELAGKTVSLPQW